MTSPVEPVMDVPIERWWVHVWLNSVYHGVFDLNERPNRETISAHLITDNPTEAQKDALKPQFVEFISSFGPSQTANALTLWNSEVAIPCRTAWLDPTNGTKFSSATANLDLPSYIRHCSFLDYCWVDPAASFFRAWRHPVDHMWRFIIWEADSQEYGERGVSSQTYYLNDPGIADTALQCINPQPLNYLRQTSGFKAAFNNLLNAEKDQLFGFTPVATRFGSAGLDFRNVLEAEAMRWSSMKMLTDWSNPGPQNQPCEFDEGVERYRRRLTNKNLVQLEMASRKAFLVSATNAGLYTGSVEP
jgi:hypothetical protein